MRTPEFIRRCMEAGLSLDISLIAAKAFEAECDLAVDDALETRRAKERARQAKHRLKTNDKDNADNVTSRDITLEPVFERDLTGAPTRIVLPSLPSLRSEELKTTESIDSSVSGFSEDVPEKPLKKPPRSERATRLSEDWTPNEAEVEIARKAGLTEEEIEIGALEFRNYWCSRSGRGAAMLSWSKTWHNRVLALAGRKRERGERLAASSSRSGGGRSGAGIFADLYARDYVQPED